jgi:hypothetical protein
VPLQFRLAEEKQVDELVFDMEPRVNPMPSFPSPSVPPPVVIAETTVSVPTRVSHLTVPTLAPYQSLIVQGRASERTVRKRSSLHLDAWAQHHLPSRVWLALNSRHGKDTTDRCFKGETTFRHVWIFLLKRNYLTEVDQRALFQAQPKSYLLRTLLREHADVDFRPLQAPIPQGVNSEAVLHAWSRMFTACLLHYDLDVPTAVRFVGGIHTGDHRHWSTLAPTLEEAGVDTLVIRDLRRIFVDGSPNTVNADSSDSNFHDFLAYGNHKTVVEDVSKTKAALTKDCMRSYALTANPLLTYFLYDFHLTPMGLVDLDKPTKTPRPIFDASFHPEPWSWALNDWTTKETEPPIFFATSFQSFLIWLYNLRISYPHQEIYVGDDDVSGAFRHNKYHPNVVGMHCYLIFGFLFFGTGLNFGSNTSASNWETVAQARQQLAQFLWSAASTIPRVQGFLPRIETAVVPNPQAIADFTPAELDSLNPGVLRSDGTRRSPTYDHHVDDCLYADVKLHLLQTVGASVLALYLILGFPDASKGVRDCVSWEKFHNLFSHKRKTIGWRIDSRRMTVSLPDDKRDRLLERLRSTLTVGSLNLREIGELLGHLGFATTVCRWMRCAFFNLQNALRTLLMQRYFATKHAMERKNRTQQIASQLPHGIRDRLQRLVSREIAQKLWGWRQQYRLSAAIRRELHAVLTSLESEPWEIFIPQVIPRDAHFHSEGDASQLAGGATSVSLSYWFRVMWSDRIRRGVKLDPKHSDYVHINCLEFIVALLQVVAAVVRLEADDVPFTLAATYPNGFPAFPVLKSLTDNTATEKWASSLTTTSPRAWALVYLLGQLLQRSRLTTQTNWLAGESNLVPDWISRPDLTLSPVALRAQTFQKYPWMLLLDFFQPSLELCSVLESCLFLEPSRAPPVLPKTLGRFCPAESTTSFSAMI